MQVQRMLCLMAQMKNLLPIAVGRIIFLVSAMVLILFLIVDYRLRMLPPISLAVNQSFIAQRAWHDLHILTSCGTRPTGSHANEVLAIDFFKHQLRKIKELSHPNQNISSDVQVVSGGYYRGCNPFISANIYRNVQNFVVRLAGNDDTGNSLLRSNALMINCHFDSVPGSPGASDDAASCCIMLELLRVLAQQEKRLRHSIIFLFNGAEETGFQASHGFITQHRWAKDIRAFLNLESVGSNGKEMLFQSSPNHGWLIDMYRHAVPHPNGQVIAEDIFELELIPSNTDFRIFTDYGHIPGMDFAHTLNGYRYHTKYDNIDYLSPEVLQHTGDNMLALAKEIANSDKLSNSEEYSNDRMVYFDLFGFVFISYCESTNKHVHATILSVIISYCCLHTKGISRSSVFNEFRNGFGFTIVALGSSALACHCIAQLLDYVGKTMSWYNRTYLSFGLYGLPTLIIASIMNSYIRLTSSSHAQARLNGVNLFWAFIVIALTSMKYRSAYVPLMPVLVFLVTSAIIGLTKSQNSSRRWLYIHLTGQVLVVLWTCHFYILVTSVFIPTQGRSLSYDNPDVYIGYLTCFSTIFIGSYLVPLIGLLRNPMPFINTIAALFVLTLLSVIIMNIGFPYSGDSANPTPQRHFITHTVRKMYDINGKMYHTDSGYWFLAMDRHAKETIQTLVSPEIPIPDKTLPMSAYLPFYGLPAHEIWQLSAGGFWLPADDPIIDKEVHVNSSEPINISENHWEVTLTMKGSYTYSIQIQTRNEVKLVKWNLLSLLDNIADSCKIYEQQSYFIQVTHGLEAQPFRFTLEFETKPNHSGALVNISISTVHWEFQPTTKIANFLTQVPQWAFPVVSIASVQAFEF